MSNKYLKEYEKVEKAELDDILKAKFKSKSARNDAADKGVEGLNEADLTAFFNGVRRASNNLEDEKGPKITNRRKSNKTIFEGS